jgi:DNA-directed RNA polymerase subunit RPC12/RpoP
MSVVTCPTCGKRSKIPEGAAGRRVKCPGCGGAFAAGRPPVVAQVVGEAQEAKPSGEDPRRKAAKWLLLGLAVVVALSCGIENLFFTDRSGKYGNRLDAEEQALVYLKRKLTFPEEADVRANDPKRVEGSTWVVGGTVVAKNAFGVRTRYRWLVTLEYEHGPGEGTWREVDTSLWEDRE